MLSDVEVLIVDPSFCEPLPKSLTESEVPVKVTLDKPKLSEAWLLLKDGIFVLILCDEIIVIELDSLVEASVLSLVFSEVELVSLILPETELLVLLDVEPLVTVVVLSIMLIEVEPVSLSLSETELLVLLDVKPLVAVVVLSLTLFEFE